MNFVVCFDFMRLMADCPKEWGIKFIDDTIIDTHWVYDRLIRNVGLKLQNWIRGKVFIEPSQEKICHFNYQNNKNEEFITGFDENGNEILENCSRENDKYFKLTYFKKEVLNKYYNDPTRYEVDGFGIQSRYFSLKIDNNSKHSA